MTEKQFERYKEIVEEIKVLKELLGFCGNRHRVNGLCHYVMKIFKKEIMLGRETIYFDKPINVSDELQERIIDVIEQYVDEKEKELERL